MPKTYTAVTVANATAGNAILASDHSTNFQNVNNLIVPAACQLVRTANLTPTSATDVTWSSAAYDTDGMFSAGSPTRITINTDGLYLITAAALFTCAATLTSITGDILKNGSILYRSAPAFTSTSSYITFSFVASLAATNYLTMQMSISGGSSYVLSGNASETNAQSRLSVTWIGRTS